MLPSARRIPCGMRLQGVTIIVTHGRVTLSAISVRQPGSLTPAIIIRIIRVGPLELFLSHRMHTISLPYTRSFYYSIYHPPVNEAW